MDSHIAIRVRNCFALFCSVCLRGRVHRLGQVSSAGLNTYSILGMKAYSIRELYRSDIILQIAVCSAQMPRCCVA